MSGLPIKSHVFTALITLALITSSAYAADVDGKRIRDAEKNPAEWVTHGGTYGEQRFSPLKKINADNAKNLGLAWFFDLDTNRGQEATPLIIDGTMYFTSAWSKAFAVDARTGKEKWRFDPQVAREKSGDACCDVVNRGVAAWGSNVYLGTLDGRLIALDMVTGKPTWSVQTTDPKGRYTITGAPRIVKGKVIIGNGGGELGVRGYVTAYDAASGKQLWRFYTVPGNPKDGFEDAAMEKAAKTWAGEWWEYGGGGTVWDSMAYDAELDLLYIGVGNGSPWNYQIRSKGQGDNLFLSSIVALKPDTGEYVWHFQTTPGESWDYTATQHIILADLDIKGAKRKVLMQAPKNGFFYVIDRKTGQFISANNYVNVSWATGVDPLTGRPAIVPEALYITEPAMVAPSPLGGHNWFPMSFSPLTKLVYIPSLESPSRYAQAENFKMSAQGWNIGVAFSGKEPNPDTVKTATRKPAGAALLAWDPIAQREVWRVDYPRSGNGGLLSTAGNLLFQGSADGFFNVYSADKGQKLWSFAAQDAMMGGPVTYELDGEQYVAGIAGLGGAASGGMTTTNTRMQRAAHGRMLVFKLGGTAQLPALEGVATETRRVPNLARANVTGDAAAGRLAYEKTCAGCHGVDAVGAAAPDLRYVRSIIDAAEFKSIVLDGARSDKGMIGFAALLKPADAEAIRAYLVSRAAAIAPQ
ncbi:MAG: PQQ-dependent dehydrogenase, methanol/ethanol family [Candidatus Obscuribacterales bacterium]|nr:PQQ-dependent dehydrogenase, methanol/ethanol family [Steroidobacteraceae bacterium]